MDVMNVDKLTNGRLLQALELIRTDPRVVTIDENTVVHRLIGEWTRDASGRPWYVHPLGAMGGGVMASLVDLPADTQVLCLAHEDGDFAVIYTRGVQAREELFRLFATALESPPLSIPR